LKKKRRNLKQDVKSKGKFNFLISFLRNSNGAFSAWAYDLEKLCGTGEWETECNQLSEEECQNLCNQCLDYLNQKGAQVQQEISETSQKKQTLQNQIATLNKKLKI